MYFEFALSKFTHQSVAGLRKSLWPNGSSVLMLDFICNFRIPYMWPLYDGKRQLK